MASTRRLTAILAADVAGYSRLMGADEEGTHERLKAHRRELVDPKIREHQGRIIKTTGDGMLVEFASVVDAMRCAAEVQRGMIDREPDVLGERCIRFRIGVNLGDVIAEGGDIFGDGVNVAARLETLAEPGGICVSRTVREQIRDKLSYPLEDLGEQTVKNIARPVRVYGLRPEAVAELPAAPTTPRQRSVGVTAIAAAVAAALVIAVGVWWLWPAEKTSSTPAVTAATSISQPFAVPRLSIVVLPFVNLNNDPEQQYFVDALTEDLTTDLSQIPGMFVISRNTAFTYRNKLVNAKEIGRDLGVRFVLEGSVRRSGSQTRVNAQLIDAENNAHLWAERFDRDTSDLVSLQNEITGRIANTLNLELLNAEAAHPTDNPDALEYILRGRAVFATPPTRGKYAEVVSLFERALALDPRSVDAQSYLAWALAARVLDNMTDTAAADIARAEGLVGQALTASPRSPLAHLAKGQVLRVKDRYKEAIPEYQTVIALNPNWVHALHSLASCKFFTGLLEEVIPLEEQAIRLSPRDPNIGNWYFRIGQVHLLQSRTDEAILWLERARSASEKFSGIRANLASAYALRGDTGRAVAELAEAQKLAADGRYSSIAHVGAKLAGVQTVRALVEATYFVGLRLAGMPEE